MKPIDLRGDWALVTGASSGIGKEFALQLAVRGVNLVLVARSEQRLTELSGAMQVETRVVSADLSSADGTKALLAKLDEIDLPIRHVVNNAGMGGAGHFIRQDPGVIEAMTALNTLAPALITRYFAPKFVDQREGGFIQVASTGALVPVPYMATYGATKAYLLSLSAALAEEVGEYGVRVCTVCPGPVPTEFQQRAGYELHGMQGKNKMSAEEVASKAIAAYCRGETVFIPGRMNALQMFAQRVLSTQLKAKAAGVVMRRSGRDRVN